jgi:WD40 repeat protein
VYKNQSMSLLASSGPSNSIQLLDAATYKPIGSLSHRDPVNTVSFSPDGTKLASGSGKVIKIWDLVTLTGDSCARESAEALTRKNYLTPIARIAAVGSVCSLCFSNVGDKIAYRAAFADKYLEDETTNFDRVVVLCTATYSQLWNVRCCIRVFSTICFSNDDQYVLTSAVGESIEFENVLRCFDSSDGCKIWDINMADRYGDDSVYIRHVVVSPDGEHVAVAVESAVLIFELSTLAQHLTLEGHLDDISCICYGLGGDMIISASIDRSVKFWDTSTGVLLMSIQCRMPIISLSFNNELNRVVCSIQNNRAIMFDALSGVKLNEINCDGFRNIVSYSPAQTILL